MVSPDQKYAMIADKSEVSVFDTTNFELVFKTPMIEYETEVCPVTVSASNWFAVHYGTSIILYDNNY
jgi:DNA-binding beta-propeller fold protein YncE